MAIDQQKRVRKLKRDTKRLSREAPLKLVTFRDIAWMYGMSVATVRNWNQRYPDFPRPVAIVNGFQRVFDRDEVQRWFQGIAAQGQRNFGKPAQKTRAADYERTA